MIRCTTCGAAIAEGFEVVTPAGIVHEKCLPWKFTIDGPDFSRKFTNHRGEKFKLSLHVVMDTWPPDSLKLRLEGDGVDYWATYVHAEESDGSQEEETSQEEASS